MFDIKSVNKRYFELKLSMDTDKGDKTIKLKVEPPKLKVIKLITSITKSKDNTLEDLAQAIKMILDKNKDGVKVPIEYIEELDMDQMNSLLTSYFKWLQENKNSKN